jgi:hypothetical protein
MDLVAPGLPDVSWYEMMGPWRVGRGIMLYRIAGSLLAALNIYIMNGQ